MGAVDQLVNLTKALKKQQAQPPPELALDRRAMVAPSFRRAMLYLRVAIHPNRQRSLKRTIGKWQGTSGRGSFKPRLRRDHFQPVNSIEVASVICHEWNSEGDSASCNESACCGHGPTASFG